MFKEPCSTLIATCMENFKGFAVTRQISTDWDSYIVDPAGDIIRKEDLLKPLIVGYNKLQK